MRTPLPLVAALLVLLAMSSSLYTLSETEQAIEDPYVAGQVETAAGIAIVLDAGRLLDMEKARLEEGGP